MKTLTSFNPVDLRDVLNALRIIKEDGPREGQGICTQVYRNTDTTEAEDILCSCFRRWDNYSGYDLFPIPDEAKEYSSDYGAFDISFRRAEAKGALWDRSTRYGQLRWELLGFLIDAVEKAIVALSNMQDSANCEGN